MELETLRKSRLDTKKEIFEKGEPHFPRTYTEKRPEAAKKSNGDRLATLLINADVLIKFGEAGAAKHLIREALYLHPNSPEALKRLISCLDKKREADQLILCYRALLKSENNFENLASLGHSLYVRGQDSEAFEIYRQALIVVAADDKGQFEVYKNMGNILVKEQDFDGAEEFYNKAFVVNPQSDVLQVNIGTLALQREDTESALQRFRQALEINSANDKAWVGLGLLHNQMGDHWLAYANIETAIEINCQNRTAVQLATTWSIRDQKYHQAIELLQSYLSSVEFDEELSLLLSHAFCLIGRFELAHLEIERLLLWEPSHQVALQIEREIREQQEHSVA